MAIPRSESEQRAGRTEHILAQLVVAAEAVAVQLVHRAQLQVARTAPER